MLIVKRGNGKDIDVDQKWYDFVNRISNRVVHHFGDHMLNQLSGANLFNLFSSAGSAGALYSLLAPYFVSFSLFSRERQLTDRITSHFKQKKVVKHTKKQPINVAHFTDTFYEVNGVALTLQQQVRIARKTGKKLTIVTCDTEKDYHMDGVKNFKPIGVYELPVYREQKLFYPPFLEMLNYCYEQQFDRINTATPGPIGLTALGIARILNLPISGTYHTSIPQYAGYLTDDNGIEEFMWKYTLWFYRQMDYIYVPSQSTGQELIEKGVRADKIRIFPRGIDIRRFHPTKQDSDFIKKYTGEAQFKLLYVGRVSKEKNLPMLAQLFKSLLRRSKHPLSLIVAGDGPYLEEMKAELAGTPTCFTGYLHGDSLAKLYASCDLFVFPSTTDTFGNVVLEAQASGLPVVVTDMGGPQENLIPGKTGLVVPAEQEKSMKEAIQTLMGNPMKLEQMGKAARRYMEDRSFDHAFQETWDMYQNSVSETRKPRFDFAKAV
jgi:glycosyltransferase involved in cell wall biosynthesis